MSRPRRSISESDIVSDITDYSDERSERTFSEDKENNFFYHSHQPPQFHHHHRSRSHHRSRRSYHDEDEISMDELNFLHATGACLPTEAKRKRKCVLESEKRKSYLNDIDSPPLEAYDPLPPKPPKVSTGRRGRPPKMGPDGLPLRKPAPSSKVYVPVSSDGNFYLFSTLLANISGKMVIEGRCKSIIDYHKSIHFPNNELTEELVRSIAKEPALFLPVVTIPAQTVQPARQYVPPLSSMRPSVPVLSGLPYRMMHATQKNFASQMPATAALKSMQIPIEPKQNNPEPVNPFPVAKSVGDSSTDKLDKPSVDTFSPVSKLSEKPLNSTADSSSWDDRKEDATIKFPLAEHKPDDNRPQNVRKELFGFSKFSEFPEGSSTMQETTREN